MSKIFLLAVLFSLSNSKSHSQKSNKKLQSKRPYGELNPRDTIGIQMKYKQQVYEFCRRIPECNMCAETHHCGWCEDHCSPVAKFVGEGKNHPESCSVGGWLTVPAQCGLPKIHMGTFTNVAPEAIDIITPQLANPNINVRISDDIMGSSQFRVPLNPATQEFGYHGLD